MRPPKKCSLELYIQFLTANHNRYSSLELAHTVPEVCSHDTQSRWLSKQSYTPEHIWQTAKPLVDLLQGYLICDDSVLDKRFSRNNEITHCHYSGNVHGLVTGIDMVNLLWTSGENYIPVDYRIYDMPNDKKTKNDHFRDMLKKAKKRGFIPKYVLMDSWYSSIENLKYIDRDCSWKFITALKSNRKISLVQGSYISVSDLDFTETPVMQVWLKGYGYVLVSVIVDQNGNSSYICTNDLTLTEFTEFKNHQDMRWNIEEYHRGLKQTTGVEGCYSIKASSQKTHIFAAVLTFLRFEKERLRTGVSWYEQKARISRVATRGYLGFA